MNRRQFFTEATWQIMRWTPWLGLLGFRFHQYHAAGVAAHGYQGWITWGSRLIGFVPK